MTYKVTFLKSAQKEWNKLPESARLQFSKKLKERRGNPHIPSAKLKGGQNHYKIKLRSLGYRLVYRVYDDRLVIQIAGMGKRDKQGLYAELQSRLN